MFKAIIIEDEHKLRESLFLMLQQTSATLVSVIGVAENIGDAVDVIDTMKPDMVFMDIQLKDGTGFDVLEKLNHRSFHLIFTTAYQEYAIKAFKYSAVDYLLKPIDPIELKESIQRIAADKLKYTDQEQVQVLKEGLSKKTERISLPTSEGLHIVALADIIRCETSGSYTTFHLVNDRKVMVSKSLKSFEELLAPPVFFRIHQSHTVNMHFVDTYSKSGMLILKDKTELPLAQRKKDEFIRLLSSYF